MSRNSKLVENPAIRTFKWKNEKFDKKSKSVTRETGWYYWDKTANNGDGADIMVEMPVSFLWLESAQSYTGYNQKTEKGLYSNEILSSPDAVKKYGRLQLDLKSDGETLLSGFYADIKEEAKGMGAKFCIPVYAAMEIDGEYQIVRFLMTGSSGSAWMEFNNRQNNMTKMIVCSDKKSVEMKTGDTYDEPVFKYIAATPEQVEKANELVENVDDYFNYIFDQPKENASNVDY